MKKEMPKIPGMCGAGWGGTRVKRSIPAKYSPKNFVEDCLLLFNRFLGSPYISAPDLRTAKLNSKYFQGRYRLRGVLKEENKYGNIWE